MEKRQRTLVAASVAGLLAAAGAIAASAAQEPAGTPTVPCYGINKCKGTGDCGGKGHSCHGENACNAQGYLDLEKDTCLKIQGGRLTEEPAA